MSELVRVLLTNGWTPGATGIWILVIVVIGYIGREFRETRKLSIEDRQARREGYTAQVDRLQSQVINLQDENRDLRRDLSTLHGEHDEYRKLCRLETDQLRSQIVEMQDHITGLERKIAQKAVTNGRIRSAEL